MKRRLFIVSSLSAALAGCGAVTSKLNENDTVRRLLGSVEPLNRALIGTHGLARQYTRGDITADFPINSFDTPSDKTYENLLRSHFHSYRLTVSGMVDRPLQLSMAQLQAMPQRSQITRHDCVEGWSAIAQWSGVRLADVLQLAGVQQRARYVVFRTFDRDDAGAPYYESLDLTQAAHPQTLLALQQNDAPIPPDRGAPVRLKIPLQLGYKNAKWVRAIELVDSFRALYGGKGGYWEDQGYQWYAGV